MISVREERAEDREAVRRVEEAAFGRAEEADIVDALRGDEAAPAWMVRGELEPGLIRFPAAFGP